MSQNNSASRELARVDESTGEVVQFEGDTPLSDSIIPFSALNGLVEQYRAEQWPESRMPVHLAALEALNITDDERLALEEAYNQESITMKEFALLVMNMDVRVWGMTVFEHGPYKGKDGQMHEGYYSPRFLVEHPKTGELLVVRTSSSFLGEHMFYAMRKYGWWLFEEPITYQFKLGTSGALFMTHIYQEGESLKKRLTRKVKVS